MRPAVWWRAGLASSVALTGVVVAQARAWDNSPLTKAVVRHAYHCGAHDHREPGLQGQVPKADQDSGEAKKGYNCGLELVGYSPLDKTADGKDTTRSNANANMSWAGRCAYVSGSSANLCNPPVVTSAPEAEDSGPGIAVVDVHNPANPTMVEVLRMP